MARVLVPGGRLMIYVWAMEQKNRHFEKQDVLIPWDRTLCSQPLSECGQWGRRRLCGHGETSRTPHPPCSNCGCSVCFKKPCASRRSHSVDYAPVTAASCCAPVSKEDNGFYNALGKSFRSWFSSRSLDESSLRKQTERVKPLRNTEEWANGTVSVQPSRLPSCDFEPQEPFFTVEQNLEEDVFEDASSQKPLEWLGVPGALKHLNGDPQRGGKRHGGGDFLESANSRDSCPHAADLKEGDPPASTLLSKIPALDSADSNSEDTISLPEEQSSDPEAFMRYYHVFREGELCSLLTEHVSELRILSSGNDHGNWCIIAEKKGSWD